MKPNKNRNNGNYSHLATSDQGSLIATGPANQDNELMVLFSEMDKLDDEISIVLKERTKELTTTIAQKDKFFATLAHDLRSPFSVILISIELLKTKLDQYNKPDFEKYINLAFNSATNSLKLLDNLLAWIISQSNNIQFIPVKIDLHKLILDEIARLKTVALEKQIVIKHTIASNLNVTANLEVVKTLLADLIGIAIKYSPANGTITIRVSESNQFVEIAIEEDGNGIVFEAHKNLFKIDSFRSTEGIN